MPEFDFPTAIKELAEARIRCPQGSLAFKGESDQQWLCLHEAHGYAGYYEPFATLREKCSCCQYPEDPCECVNLGLVKAGCNPCEGRGWVPLSDVEKACWELAKVEKQVDELFFTVQYRDRFWEWYDPMIDDARRAESAEEAVLRAALAWVIEQHGVFGGEERSHDSQLL